MMASTSRPTLRSSSGRLAGPAGEQHVHDMAASHHSPASATPHMSSRHSLPSKAFPRPSQLDALPSDAHLTNAKSSLVSPQRKLSRKRKAVSISDDADVSLASLKPPTRFSVARSHGRSLEPVNGVQRPSDINEDRKSPAASSPKAASTSSSNVAVNGVTFKEPNNARVASRSTRGAVLGEEKRGNVDKRTLRSQDGGSRLKSDLATYFANYDDVITDAPQEPEFIGLDTPIHIVGDNSKAAKSRSDTAQARSGRSRSKTPASRDAASSKTPLSSPTYTRTSNSTTKSSSTSFQVIDFSSINRNTSSTDTEDPLGDNIYFAPHRRAERKEKQLRNIEKERAMHEKVQLERLLDGLKGHDWLKVMGITGITDGERKDWEPKRNYFISEVQALVDKFKIWKEAEKRLKMEKEALLHAKETTDEEEEEEEEDEEEESESDAGSLASTNEDTQAAKQLQLEANSASSPAPTRLRIRLKRALPSYLPPPEVDPNKPFTSFYAKPHLRAAALGQHRHGRGSMAFGQPIPEWTCQEFGLPSDYITPDALKDHARKKRRLKREKSTTDLKKQA